MTVSRLGFFSGLGALSARSGFGVGLGVYVLSAIVWVWRGLDVGLMWFGLGFRV